MNFWNAFWTNFSQMTGFFLAAVSAVAVVHAREWYQKRSKRDLRKLVTADAYTYQIMSEMRSISDADRIKLFQIINGNYYFGGTSDQKLTLTHLINKVGISYPEGLSGSRQTIAISHATELLQHCLDKGTVMFEVENMTNSAYFRQLFIASGTKWMIAYPLFNSKHQCVGVVMATWVHGKPELSEREHHVFKGFVDQLSVRINDQT